MNVFKIKLRSLLEVNEAQSVLGLMLLVYAFKNENLGYLILSLSALFLALNISSAVHNAEVIAKRIGPSLGTLVLALSVTIIEVALIINLMKSNPTTAGFINTVSGSKTPGWADH